MSRLLGPTVAEVSGSIRLACIPPAGVWACFGGEDLTGVLVFSRRRLGGLR